MLLDCVAVLVAGTELGAEDMAVAVEAAGLGTGAENRETAGTRAVDRLGFGQGCCMAPVAALGGSCGADERCGSDRSLALRGGWSGGGCRSICPSCGRSGGGGCVSCCRSGCGCGRVGVEVLGRGWGRRWWGGIERCRWTLVLLLRSSDRTTWCRLEDVVGTWVVMGNDEVMADVDIDLALVVERASSMFTPGINVCIVCLRIAELCYMVLPAMKCFVVCLLDHIPAIAQYLQGKILSLSRSAQTRVESSVIMHQIKISNVEAVELQS